MRAGFVEAVRGFFCGGGREKRVGDAMIYRDHPQPRLRHLRPREKRAFPPNDREHPPRRAFASDVRRPTARPPASPREMRRRPPRRPYQILIQTLLFLSSPL